ncbi:7975_t:CDS:1, partial [Acaulospora colombiana]
MVNRTWCQIVVPILWQYPFGDQWDGGHKIVPVYLGCLPEGTKARIKEMSVDFPDSALASPTFNYVKYLRRFNFQALHIAVKVWCNDQWFDNFIDRGETLKSNPVTKLLDILINCIMEQSLNLKVLEILVTSRRKGEYVNLESREEFSRPCLAKIEILECDDCIPKDLTFASEFCTSLTHLKIECSWGNDKEVSALIKAQKNLKRLTISKRWPQMRDALESGNLRNSLKIVELKNNLNLVYNSGPLAVLSTLNNLEVLRFEKWKIFREDNIMELASISFPRLRKIVLSRSKFSPQAINLMITTNGAHLQELTLYWERENSSNQFSHVIRTVAENCPNIRFFDAPVERKEIHELYQLLRSCKKLESLIINDSEEEP